MSRSLMAKRILAACLPLCKGETTLSGKDKITAKPRPESVVGISRRHAGLQRERLDLPSQCINNHEDDFVKRRRCMTLRLGHRIVLTTCCGPRSTTKQARHEDEHAQRNHDICCQQQQAALCPRHDNRHIGDGQEQRYGTKQQCLAAGQDTIKSVSLRICVFFCRPLRAFGYDVKSLALVGFPGKYSRHTPASSSAHVG